MLAVSASGWALTLAVILACLGLDLVTAGREGALAFAPALAWTVGYTVLAILFGVVLGVLAGWAAAGQYFAGFLVEKSLSIDNLFVFVIIVATFAVPARAQPRALTVGIVVALILRAALIAVGAALIAAFSFMFLVFGLLLLATAVQLYRHRDTEPDIERNPVLAFARRRLRVSASYDGIRLVTSEGGRRVMTPLVLVLLAIGSADVVFALDSIPAVFGVTQHPYIVFAANAFALLGLRPLFFLVAGLLDWLVHLSAGLAIVLAFIGVKLILEFAHTHSHAVPTISTGASLIVIALVLGVTAVTSLRSARSRGSDEPPGRGSDETPAPRRDEAPARRPG
jgi:tellurite resistance protein TerC